MVGDHIAWVQYDAAPAGQAPPSHALYVYTISSGTTVRVTDAVTPYWGERACSRSAWARATWPS